MWDAETPRRGGSAGKLERTGLRSAKFPENTGNEPTKASGKKVCGLTLSHGAFASVKLVQSTRIEDLGARVAHDQKCAHAVEHGGARNGYSFALIG
jgi:hypothetical protein